MKPNAFVKFWVWDFAALRVRRRFSKLSRQHVQPLNSISTAWSSSIRVHSAIDVGAGKFLGVRKIFARISLNLRISLNRISLKGSLVCPGFQVFCEHYHRFCLELARIFRDFARIFDKPEQTRGGACTPEPAPPAPLHSAISLWVATRLGKHQQAHPNVRRIRM